MKSNSKLYLDLIYIVPLSELKYRAPTRRYSVDVCLGAEPVDGPQVDPGKPNGELEPTGLIRFMVSFAEPIDFAS